MHTWLTIKFSISKCDESSLDLGGRLAAEVKLPGLGDKCAESLDLCSQLVVLYPILHLIRVPIDDRLEAPDLRAAVLLRRTK